MATLSPTRLAARFPLLVLVHWLLVIGIGLLIAVSAGLPASATSAAGIGR